MEKCGQMHKPEWTSGRAANQTHKLSLDVGKDGDHAVDPVDSASTAASARRAPLLDNIAVRPRLELGTGVRSRRGEDRPNEGESEEDRGESHCGGDWVKVEREIKRRK